MVMFAERREHVKVCDCDHSEGNRGKPAVLYCRLNLGRREYNCLSAGNCSINARDRPILCILDCCEAVRSAILATAWLIIFVVILLQVDDTVATVCCSYSSPF